MTPGIRITCKREFKALSTPAQASALLAAVSCKRKMKANYEYRYLKMHREIQHLKQRITKQKDIRSK